MPHAALRAPSPRLSAPRRARLTALLLALTILLPLLACALPIFCEAPGDKVVKKKSVVVDCSHADQGYVMIKYKESKKRLKVRLTQGSDNYTYDLNQDGEYEAFPLQLGSGTYKVQVFQQTSGSRYNSVASVSFKAKLSDELAPYLCPSQYVWYDAQTAAVARSDELCAGLTSEADKANALCDFVSRTIVYDHILALTVKSGYLPVIDEVLEKQRGICFDYAALLACMLRVQGIPTQLVIGYADNCYHSWNNVWVNGAWVRYDATAMASNLSFSTYTTDRVY